MRSLMTSRAHWRRPAADQSGWVPNDPTLADLGVIPCHRTIVRRIEHRGAEKTLLIEEERVTVPPTASIQEGDLLDAITDRAGTVQVAGPLRIGPVVIRATHREAQLLRVR